MTKEKRKFELRATQRAYEKLQEIINGSKERVNEFIHNVVNEGINPEDYPIFLKNTNEEFNYHKCNNTYIIFTIKEHTLTLVDFLSETEFKERKGKQD